MYRALNDVHRNWPVFVGLCLLLAVWCALDVQRRGRTDPVREDVHKTDFTVYTEAGAAFYDGREPYEVTNPRGWGYLYPPLLALLVAPLHALNPRIQVSIWFAISCLCAFGSYFETRHLLEFARRGWSNETNSDDSAAPRADGLWVGWLAMAAIAFPTLNCLQRGQIGLPQLYFLLLGFRLVTASVQTGNWRTWFAGGFALAVPIVLKLTPLLPVACLLGMLTLPALIRRRELPRALWAGAGTLCGGFVLVFVIPALLIGWQANIDRLGDFQAKVMLKLNNVRGDDFGGEVDSPRNQSLDNAVYRLGLWLSYKPDIGRDGKPIVWGDRPRIGPLPVVKFADQLADSINAALLAALAGVVAVLAFSRRPLAYGVGFGLACVASLIVSPVSRGHYFVMLLPAVLFIPLWLWNLGRRRAARFAAWAPAVLTIFHYLFLNSAGRLGVYGLGIALWYAAACLLVLPWPSWKRRSVSRNFSRENLAMTELSAIQS